MSERYPPDEGLPYENDPGMAYPDLDPLLYGDGSPVTGYDQNHTTGFFEGIPASVEPALERAELERQFAELLEDDGEYVADDDHEYDSEDEEEIDADTEIPLLQGLPVEGDYWRTPMFDLTALPEPNLRPRGRSGIVELFHGGGMQSDSNILRSFPRRRKDGGVDAVGDKPAGHIHFALDIPGYDQPMMVNGDPNMGAEARAALQLIGALVLLKSYEKSGETPPADLVEFARAARQARSEPA